MIKIKKIICLAVVVLAAPIGGFLVAGYGEDDRSQWWLRKHLEVIQDQLQGLSANLQMHKKSHGRYPTNDEGLAAIDSYQARFTVTTYLPPPAETDEDQWIHAPRYFWEHWKSAVALYRAKHGRVPASDQELMDVFDITSSDYAEEDKPPKVRQAEVAIGEGDNLYILSPAGVLSPWHTPYVYENRNGLDAARFIGSPADSDIRRWYSVKVDDGIYIYCMGGQYYAERLDERQWADIRPRIAGGILLVLAGVSVVLMFRQSVRAGIEGAISMAVLGGLGVASGNMSYETCYIMSPLFSHRNPKMVARQRELLDRYHRSGVIGDDTFAKAMSALELGAASQPTSQAGSEPSLKE